MVEYVPDFKISTNDRDLIVKEETTNGNTIGTIEFTAGFEALQQALAIRVSNEVRQVLAGTLTPEELDRLRSVVHEELSQSMELSTVNPVSVKEINKQTNTVSFRVRTAADDEFTIGVTG